MARTTKGTQQKRRSKGDGSLFPNKRGGWTARYRKKGLPDKEFNAPTKGEAKALLDDWKIKVAIQDAITSNIKVFQLIFENNVSLDTFISYLNIIIS